MNARRVFWGSFIFLARRSSHGSKKLDRKRTYLSEKILSLLPGFHFVNNWI